MGQTLFISDLHLDDSRPRIIDLFARFLRDEAPRADSLYILGDLFELWIGDDAVAPGLRDTLGGLRELSDRGVPVWFQHGNRDFLIGQEFARMSGCRLLPEEAVIDLYGTPTLIMHGDTLCTDDARYQAYRARVRRPWFRRLLLSLSPAMRLGLANYMRRTSRREVRDKSPQIMDVNPQAVEEAMVRRGVTQLIHGHTHRPAIHRFGLASGPATRIVLGDWYDHGSVLRCRSGDCALSELRPG